MARLPLVDAALSADKIKLPNPSTFRRVLCPSCERLGILGNSWIWFCNRASCKAAGFWDR